MFFTDWALTKLSRERAPCCFCLSLYVNFGIFDKKLNLSINLLLILMFTVYYSVFDKLVVFCIQCGEGCTSSCRLLNWR